MSTCVWPLPQMLFWTRIRGIGEQFLLGGKEWISHFMSVRKLRGGLIGYSSAGHVLVC